MLDPQPTQKKGDKIKQRTPLPKHDGHLVVKRISIIEILGHTTMLPSPKYAKVTAMGR
jgi:hypothetical protein